MWCKKTTNAHKELLIIVQVELKHMKALTKPARKIRLGDIIVLSEDVYFECYGIETEGVRVYKAHHQKDMLDMLERIGTFLLPPYIKHTPKDDSRYQTVYAKHIGFSAPPTAGLHFTKDIISKLLEKGVIIVDRT